MESTFCSHLSMLPFQFCPRPPTCPKNLLIKMKIPIKMVVFRIVLIQTPSYHNSNVIYFSGSSSMAHTSQFCTVLKLVRKSPAALISFKILERVMQWSFQKMPIQSLRGGLMRFGGFYWLVIYDAWSSVLSVQSKVKN